MWLSEGKEIWLKACTRLLHEDVNHNPKSNDSKKILSDFSTSYKSTCIISSRLSIYQNILKAPACSYRRMYNDDIRCVISTTTVTNFSKISPYLFSKHGDLSFLL